MYSRITTLVILFLPILCSILWHSSNTAFPNADAATFITTANHITSKLFIDHDFFGFMYELLAHRNWRPIGFHLLIVPFLLITGGNIMLTVGIVHTLCVSIAVYFLYKIFSVFSTKVLSALGASILAMMFHIQFGGMTGPLFSEIAFIPFTLGALYFLMQSDFFENIKYSKYFIIFFALSLIMRPIEGFLYLILPIIFYIWYGIKIKKINPLHAIESFLAPSIFAVILVFSADTDYIKSRDGENAYNIYLTGLYLVSFVSVSIIFIFYYYKKYKNYLPVGNSKSYIKATFSFASLIVFIFYFPSIEELFSWIYRTSFGDVVAHYRNDKSIVERLKEVILVSGYIPTLTILAIPTLYFLNSSFRNNYIFSEDGSSNSQTLVIIKKIKKFFSKNDSILFQKKTALYLMLLVSIIIPLGFYIFSLQSTTYRKITPAFLSLMIMALLFIFSRLKLGNIRYVILIPLLAGQLYAFNSINYTEKNIRSFHEGNKTKSENAFLGVLPYPVNLTPNAHVIVMSELDLILEKHKIKDVAIAIKADGDVPVDPFQLTMLSSSKAYNLQFPYVAKYNKDNLDFIDGKEGLLLINPLGKMEDSKKQLEILENIVSIGPVKALEYYYYYTLEEREADILQGIPYYNINRNASANTRYTFLLQLYYAKDLMHTIGWKEIECFAVNEKYSGCVFHKENFK